MTDTPNPPELIGTAEAAAVLGIDRSTVVRLVARGVIPTAGKLGGPTGAHLFQRSELAALVVAGALRGVE